VYEEGMGRFLYGITEEMSQRRREELLDVSREQVRDVAQRYVVDALEGQKERMVFLGEKREWVGGEWKVVEMDINGSA
jgi:Zn-dependent M16 (insulinase) family peptidase